MKVSHGSSLEINHRRPGPAAGCIQSPKSKDSRNPGITVLNFNQMHQMPAEGNLVPAMNPIHVFVEAEIREMEKYHIDGSGITHREIAGYDKRQHARKAGVTGPWAIRKVLDSNIGETGNLG